MNDESLPKAARVRKRREYSELQKGRRIATAHFVFFVLKRLPPEGEQPARSRLGLIVSRKVGNAIARNLVKRRSREIFRREHQARLGLGWDWVVLARPGAAAITLDEMRAQWAKALRRV